MDTRERELHGWVLAALNLDARGTDWQPVAGDASARRYFRLRHEKRAWIAVDAPPASEKNREFLAVRELLANANVRVPELLDSTLEQGYLLLEDLGEQLLLPMLTPATVDGHYQQALQVLASIQSIDTAAAAAKLPAYDSAVLAEELQRFPEWFVEGLLQITVTSAWSAQLQDFFQILIESAAGQPQVVVHRDFHSRNLMPQDDGSLGVIDFQDAVLGPVCYDLVSLLRDCYIRWPAPQVRGWALDYYHQSSQTSRVSDEQFMRWFDLIGLQRHLKVLGNFSRLALRDQRDTYLSDIPMVLDYVVEVLAVYPEFEWLNDWFRVEVQPRVLAQVWEASP
ncbi:aminoglycoside phosphotransferase [Halieaceae bacterium IMCC14734]|uniref:Aminoglycoside phosphotransferase n=1 Tax=Candidatus Litorirhabdus singularis TaxID=2518993 RepID=A0ABT3TPU9_9GAMM|nr:phosphotransferase [Candidatus Litorirhabdus singularis]MCX2983357.1 aminoglycoside phosphotransferase [Candidatus Litorirhabdus singularis]